MRINKYVSVFSCFFPNGFCISFLLFLFILLIPKLIFSDFLIDIFIQILILYLNCKEIYLNFFKGEGLLMEFNDIVRISL